ncbi:hypothetical protein FOL47_009353, partial [Perkinsus chesapeaki]
MLAPSIFLEEYGKTRLRVTHNSSQADESTRDMRVTLRWAVACDIVEFSESWGIELIREHYLVEEILIELMQSIVLSPRGSGSPNTLAAIKFIRRLGLTRDDRIQTLVDGIAEEFKDALVDGTSSLEIAKSSAISEVLGLSLHQLFRITHSARSSLLGVDNKGYFDDYFARVCYESANREARAFLNSVSSQSSTKQLATNVDEMLVWPTTDAIEEALTTCKAKWVIYPQETTDTFEDSSITSMATIPKTAEKNELVILSDLLKSSVEEEQRFDDEMAGIVTKLSGRSPPPAALAKSPLLEKSNGPDEYPRILADTVERHQQLQGVMSEGGGGGVNSLLDTFVTWAIQQRMASTDSNVHRVLDYRSMRWSILLHLLWGFAVLVKSDFAGLI